MSVLNDIAKDDAKLEMTPMIDVTFLLLIFFMCTIKFKTLEGKLEAFLPKQEGISRTEAPTLDALEVTLTVERPGQRIDLAAYETAGQVTPWDGVGDFYLLGHTVAYRLGRSTFAGDAAGRAQLLAAIARAQAAQPGRAVKLRPLGAVVQQDVVSLLDAFSAAGLDEVTITGASRR